MSGSRRNRLEETAAMFDKRLHTLDRLLHAAQAQAEKDGRDPESIMRARLAPDMLPFPYQIVYACNQPNHFAAWCRGEPPAATDPAVLSYEGLRSHVVETLAYVRVAKKHCDAQLLEREKRVDLSEGRFLRLSGAEYIDDFLVPNFYFHLVTSYGLLRMLGVTIGKEDYMAHLLARIEQEDTAAG